MRKLLKSLSTLTAFLALTLGVGYSLTQSNDMVGAKAEIYTERQVLFTSSTLESGWESNGVPGSYYKVNNGDYALGTASALFGEGNVMSSSVMTINIACGTFGTWSDSSKSVTAFAEFLDGADNTIATAEKTYTSLNSTQSVYRGNFDIVAPNDVTQISKLKITFSLTNNNDVLRFYGLKLTYETSIGTPDEPLESIEILTPATQTTFILGSDYNFDGLVIQANYASKAVQLVDGFELSPVDTMILGSQIVTVTFQDMTVDYEIRVTNEGAFEYESSVASDLFISEYIEGSGSNKAIEIFNGTGANVDLDSYKVVLYSNGSSTQGNTTNLSEFGSFLANGEVLSLVNSQSTTDFKVGNFVESTATYFNGDDAVALLKNDVVIDVIGVIGTDPGTQWSGIAANGEGSTLDRTLVRASTISSPNNQFTWSEWNVYSSDTSTFIGSHDFLTLGLTTEQKVLAFVDFVNNGIGSQGRVGGVEEGASQCNVIFEQLKLEFGYMSEEAKTIFLTTGVGVGFDDARLRIAYLESYLGDTLEGTTPGERLPMTVNNQSNNMMAIITIGGIGLSALIGYYFINKKKQYN